MQKSTVIPTLAALAVLAGAAPAAAHPHVWIDATATFRFDPQQRLTAVEARWTFDDFYSAFAVDGLDLDRDGRFSTGELEPLAQENVHQLEEWGYFSVLKAGGTRKLLGPVTDYAMSWENHRLILTMILPLAEPVDPRRTDVSFSMFDPTFYIDVAFAKEQPVHVEGAAPKGCAPRLQRFDSDQPAYVPDEVATSAEVDPADPENSIGARFADWVVLSCAAPS